MTFIHCHTGIIRHGVRDLHNNLHRRIVIVVVLTLQSEKQYECDGSSTR